MNRTNNPIAGIGQQDRVAIGGANRHREARLAGNQRISLSAHTFTINHKNKIRMNLLQSCKIVRWNLGVPGPESVLDPGEAF